jgi:hypothetical protein
MKRHLLPHILIISFVLLCNFGCVTTKQLQRYAHHCPDSLKDGVQVLEKFDYNLTTMAQNGG